jgi:hypothetical protein
MTKKTVFATSELSGIGSKRFMSENFASVFIMIGDWKE